MKNFALIIIAVVGTSVATYAQDGTKQTEPAKIEIKKRPLKTTVKKTDKKKEVPAKREVPAKK